MHAFEVGKPYPAVTPPLPRGSFFNWTGAEADAAPRRDRRAKPAA